MKIVLIGLNHNTAPVELREKLAMDSCEPSQAYIDLRRPGIMETVYLSTCNRVEFIVSSDTYEEAVDGVKEFLSDLHGLRPSEFEGHLYIYQGDEAVRHLFRVASSLDSMVVGEPQILGQLKDAFRQAVDYKATGAILNKLLHKSFSVAKRVRTETGIASHAVSIGFAAVELARKIFGELSGNKVLLIGAGEMAELAAEHLLGNGASEIIVANRTLANAVKLARRWDGRSASLEEIPTLLKEADIVISSTGAREVVVDGKMVKSILKARRHRPLFFVDIAVPRDIDPAVNRLDNVYLYDIDDLQAVVEDNRAARQQEASRAQRIVEEESIRFNQWLERLDTFPTIVSLNQKAEEIRKHELKRTIGKLDGLTEEQIDAVERLTRSLTRKLIHDPILFIKNAGRHGRKDFNLDIARRVLGLDEPTAQKDASDNGEENESGEPVLKGTGQNHNA